MLKTTEKANGFMLKMEDEMYRSRVLSRWSESLKIPEVQDRPGSIQTLRLSQCFRQDSGCHGAPCCPLIPPPLLSGTHSNTANES
ncbi:uncharacterized [Tachysurus ichikawai]